LNTTTKIFTLFILAKLVPFKIIVGENQLIWNQYVLLIERFVFIKDNWKQKILSLEPFVSKLGILKLFNILSN
jgi:hypothetical protein